MQNLSDLLAPFPLAEFLERYLHRKWLLSQAQPYRYGQLFGWDELNRILEAVPLQAPRLQLAKAGSILPEERYSVEHTFGRKVDVPRLMSLLAHGSTLVLNHVHLLSPSLLSLTHALSQQVDAKVTINLYASWRRDTAFDLHWDRHDVLVLHLAGRKQWRVYQPTRPHPLKDDIEPAPRPDGDPVWEGELHQGDLLYLPRGWWHAVTPMDEPSLHLTVGISGRKGIDVLEALVARLRQHEVVRREVPHEAATAESRDEFHAQMRSVLHEAADAMLDSILAEKGTYPTQRMSWPALPDGPKEQLKPLQQTHSVLLTAPLVLDAEAIRSGQYSWPLDQRLLPAFTRLSETASMTVADLMDIVPQELKNRLLVLLTLMSNSGALCRQP